MMRPVRDVRHPTHSVLYSVIQVSVLKTENKLKAQPKSPQERGELYFVTQVGRTPFGGWHAAPLKPKQGLLSPGLELEGLGEGFSAARRESDHPRALHALRPAKFTDAPEQRGAERTGEM